MKSKIIRGPRKIHLKVCIFSIKREKLHPYRTVKETISIEHVDIVSHNDPNPNPNHEKIMPKTLNLILTLLPGARA